MAAACKLLNRPALTILLSLVTAVLTTLAKHSTWNSSNESASVTCALMQTGVKLHPADSNTEHSLNAHPEQHAAPRPGDEEHHAVRNPAPSRQHMAPAHTSSATSSKTKMPGAMTSP
jgi:hypothetical protein